MRSSTKAIQHAAVVLLSLFFVGACSTTIAGTATTIVPVGPTDFATIPPVQSTLPNIVTTLPIGAVGFEQIYTVRAGDSSSLVANLYGIMVAELLSWNGLVSTNQFPFPGATLKIPPTATVNNPQINVAPDPSAGPSQPGCDPRPAGTYKVAKGDSMYIIRKKFCVSLASLLSANGFNSSSALLFPGQILTIPASGS